jgi:formate dehydrogenase iron-sulfur subunit
MSPMSRRNFLKVAGTGLAAGASMSLAKSVAAKADPNNYVAMLYDATICVGCNACTNACRQWNKTTVEKDPQGLYDAPTELSADTWTLIQLYQGENETSFVKRQCMHCVDPACVSGCPVHALQKTDAGPVTYDRNRCIGCRYCMYTCPYHVPRFQWKEVIPLVTKCTLCADRIADGNGPACAERCPTGALKWGKRGDLIAEAEKRLADDPSRYVQHIFGKDDAGGTSVLYLSHVSFDKLGLPNLKAEPVPQLSERTSDIFLPGIVVGGTIALAAVRQVVKNGGLEDEA